MKKFLLIYLFLPLDPISQDPKKCTFQQQKLLILKEIFGDQLGLNKIQINKNEKKESTSSKMDIDKNVLSFLLSEKPNKTQ